MRLVTIAHKKQGSIGMHWILILKNWPKPDKKSMYNVKSGKKNKNRFRTKTPYLHKH